MSSPSFLLPGCPVCSHPPNRLNLFAGIAERPRWQYAVRTSDKRNERCYFWIGCKHAEAVAMDATKNPVGHEAFAHIEEKWGAALPALLVEKTARWTETARAEFVRFLSDRPFTSRLSEHSAPTTHEPTNNDKETSPI